MKCTLISQEGLVAEFERWMNEEEISEHDVQMIYHAISIVEHQPSMFPQTECAHKSRWLKCFDHNQGTAWHECAHCRTLGSPRWKRCPVCEAIMILGGENGGD